MFVKKDYDNEDKVDIDWVNHVIYSLVREYENGNLDRGHKEACYLSHIWFMIETSFDNLKNIETVIGESTSFSMKKKKKRTRSIGVFDQMNAMKHVYRYALIFVPIISVIKSLTNLVLLNLGQRMKVFTVLKQWLRDILNRLGS